MNTKNMALLAGAALLVTACSKPSVRDAAPKHHVDVSHIPNAKPKKLARSRYGNPKSYVVFGKRYHVLPSAQRYQKTGIASWYGTKFHGRLTSTREPYNMYSMTAASPELPLPTFAQVTNLENGRQIIVKINDRGPFAPNRIIDLSYVAAKKLGIIAKGTAMVEVKAITQFDQAPTRTKYASQTVKHVSVPSHPKLYLQVGAFGSKHNAKKLQLMLEQNLQQSVQIEQSAGLGETLYRVQVGPLKGSTQSDQTLKQLNNQGFKAFTIVR